MKLKQISLGVAALFAVTTIAFATEGTLRDKGKGDDREERDCRISVEKIAAKEIKVGDFTDFFIRVKNTGNCELEDLKVVDFAPEKVQFRDAQPEPEFVKEDGAFLEKVIWEIDDLDPWETKIIHLRVHVVGPPNRTLVNEACVEFDVDDFLAQNDRGGGNNGGHDGDHGEDDEVCDKSFTRVTTGAGSNGASN